MYNNQFQNLRIGLCFISSHKYKTEPSVFKANPLALPLNNPRLSFLQNSFFCRLFFFSCQFYCWLLSPPPFPQYPKQRAKLPKCFCRILQTMSKLWDLPTFIFSFYKRQTIPLPFFPAMMNIHFAELASEKARTPLTPAFEGGELCPSMERAPWNVSLETKKFGKPCHISHVWILLNACPFWYFVAINSIC